MIVLTAWNVVFFCFFFIYICMGDRHGDRPHNYVSNDIFGFAVSPGLTKILPIEKCIMFF